MPDTPSSPRHPADQATLGIVQTQEIARHLDEIRASALQMDTLLGLIDGVALQTHIPALHAALQTHAGGGQVRGLAALTTAIRRLAQHCTQTAEAAQALVAPSRLPSDAGARLVQQADQAMQDILDGIDRVTRQLEAFNEASLSTPPTPPAVTARPPPQRHPVPHLQRVT